jgi:hypothetical protein
VTQKRTPEAPDSPTPRLSDSTDETVQAALSRSGIVGVTPAQFREWEATLPPGQRIVTDLLGDLHIAEDQAVVGPFLVRCTAAGCGRYWDDLAPPNSPCPAGQSHRWVAEAAAS